MEIARCSSRTNERKVLDVASIVSSTHGRANGAIAARAIATSARARTPAFASRWHSSASMRGFSAGSHVNNKQGRATSATVAPTAPIANGKAGTDKNILDNLLSSHAVVALAEELEEVAKTKDTMTMSELREFVRQHQGGTKTESEITATMKLLEDSGRVLVLEDLVYLHPREVTNAVLRALPGVPGKVYGVSDRELQTIQAEFEELRSNYELAQRRAAARSSLVVYGGLMLLCCQLATFVRLTYYEFSWDVMEPISYFVGLSNAIMAYGFYLWNRQDFSFEIWQKGMQDRTAERSFRAKGFDIDRYISLARRLRKTVPLGK